MTQETEKEQEPQRLKLGMEVPLWGVLVMIASIVVQGFQTYYSQKSQGEQLAKVSSDVRAIQADLNKSVVQNAGVQFKLDEYLRRLQLLEAAAAAQAARGK